MILSGHDSVGLLRKQVNPAQLAQRPVGFGFASASGIRISFGFRASDFGFNASGTPASSPR
jgi:hypothetical protein